MLGKLKFWLLKIISPIVPTDMFAKKYPVSIKAVIIIRGKVVLLKNEREEWELPGGKLESGEPPERCLEREVEEELGVKVKVTTILDAWLYNILGKVEVLIVTYSCKHAELSEDSLIISHEHKELGLFTLDEVSKLPMPQGYKDSIYRCMK
ncbi:NUDIX hydrolase [Flammeovirgaceae bacterium SG7u.111]|nr:NUDIX hydrolase [Flammeovirgaceae bacterium SG7u.132]WPO33057.1 NUDIX hydrolase [Flammeovirgaceae bacterium SG7u.111]